MMMNKGAVFFILLLAVLQASNVVEGDKGVRSTDREIDRLVSSRKTNPFFDN